MILWLLMWIVYGLVVGLIAKALHPGDDPVGFFPTLGIGIAGSYVGGFLSWLIGRGQLGEPSGIIMGIIGAVIFLWLYRQYKTKWSK